MRNRMRLSPAIEEYHAHRRGAGTANNTMRNDKSHLGRLLKVVGNIWVHDLTGRHIDQVFAAASATMAESSLNALHSSLSAFLKWATARGCLPRDVDPLYGRKYRKVTPKDRLLIPATQFDNLLTIACATTHATGADLGHPMIPCPCGQTAYPPVPSKGARG